MPGPEPKAAARPTTSTRDLAELHTRIGTWLRGRLPDDADAQVIDLHAPSGNGMSSETLLLTARWTEDGTRADHALVVRAEPQASAVPVFERYDLAGQFETMRLVRELTTVPVPRVYWLETDPAALGAPFFVMERLDGQVPPDIMPYVYGSWVTELDGAALRRMQHSTVSVLAHLHQLPAERFAFLDADQPGSSALRRHVAATRAHYDWTAATLPSPLIERGFAWLDAHWPSDEGDTTVLWGDARVGNVMYGPAATPVAVLDWEMAGLGTPEMDLSWLVYMHRVFQNSVVRQGLPGLPDFLRWDDVAAQYAQLTGHTPTHPDFYLLYTAVRLAIITLRTQLRSLHFGELAMPEDPDDLIRPRCDLEELLDAR